MSSDAEIRLINAANELVNEGWSRIRIYEAIKDALPSSDWSNKQQETDIRDIHIMLDFLSGMRGAEASDKYKLKGLSRKSCLFRGALRVCRALEVKISQDKKPILNEKYRSWWVEKGKEAILALEDKG